MSQTKVAVGMVDATGTPGSGNFLRGDGSWNAPTGGLVFLSSTDVSAAATYAFTATVAASYDSYMLSISNLIPANDGVSLYFRTSTDGGSSYDSGGSDYMWQGVTEGGDIQDNADSEIELNPQTGGTLIGSSSNEDGVSGTVYVHGPHLTKRTYVTGLLGMITNGALPDSAVIFGARLESADVDAFQLLFSAGNIETGTVTVYGMVNA